MPLHIASPCGEDWDAMEVRGRGRHCAKCDHVVVDLSRMTRAKAEAFVRAREGRRVCARLFVDPVTGEAWFPPSEATPARGAGGLVLAAALAAGCAEPPRRSAELVAVAEPRAAPPMEPIDPSALASLAPTASTGPVPAAELNAPAAAAEPTPEQRRLTAHKHRPTPQYPPPPPHYVPLMGDPAL